MTKVRREDFRALGFCNKGIRLLADSYGVSWEDLCGEGVDAEIIAATGDDRAGRVIEQAK